LENIFLLSGFYEYPNISGSSPNICHVLVNLRSGWATPWRLALQMRSCSEHVEERRSSFRSFYRNTLKIYRNKIALYRNFLSFYRNKISFYRNFLGFYRKTSAFYQSHTSTNFL